MKKGVNQNRKWFSEILKIVYKSLLSNVQKQPCADCYINTQAHSHNVEDARFLRPTEIASMRGNAHKAKQILGWESTITFEQLVKEMVESDLELLRQR